jgi:hypothetical protein
MAKSCVLWSAAIAVASACSSPSGEGEFKLVATLQGLGSGADHVAFGGSDVAVSGGSAILQAEFASYDEATAAGPLPVTFEANGAVVGSGSIGAGACRTCVYSGCPSIDSLSEEDLQYVISGSDVVPNAYMCFTCVGGGKMLRSCP